MTDQPTHRPMTPNQLRAVVYQIARTYLEVERGLRPRDQLAAFLTRAEYRRHRVTGRGQRAASRPVRPTDIGKVRLDAATPDHVKASVLVRRDDDRWSSLLVDLKQTGHGWQVERLDRLERLLPREPRHVEIDDDAVERRRRFVESDRLAAESAYRAVERRYERIPDKRTAPARALRPELDRWKRRLEKLRIESDHIGGSGMALDSEPVLLNPGDSETEVGGLLGPRPADRVAALEWDTVASEVDRYRSKWNLEPGDSLLPRDPSPDCLRDHRRLLGRVLTAHRALSCTQEEVQGARELSVGL